MIGAARSHAADLDGLGGGGGLPGGVSELPRRSQVVDATVSASWLKVAVCPVRRPEFVAALRACLNRAHLQQGTIHTVAASYCARGSVMRRHAGKAERLLVAVDTMGASSRLPGPRQPTSGPRLTTVPERANAYGRPQECKRSVERTGGIVVGCCRLWTWGSNAHFTAHSDGIVHRFRGFRGKPSTCFPGQGVHRFRARSSGLNGDPFGECWTWMDQAWS